MRKKRHKILKLSSFLILLSLIFQVTVQGLSYFSNENDIVQDVYAETYQIDSSLDGVGENIPENHISTNSIDSNGENDGEQAIENANTPLDEQGSNDLIEKSSEETPQEIDESNANTPLDEQGSNDLIEKSSEETPQEINESDANAEESEEESEEELEDAPLTPTHLTIEKNGFLFELKAEVGVLPENVSLKVEFLPTSEASQYYSALEEEYGDRLSSATLFDISIIDENNNEVQPNGEVSVTISGIQSLEKNTEPVINHINTETSHLNIETISSAQSGTEVNFNTNHFSIYAYSQLRPIGQSPDDPLFLVAGQKQELRSELTYGRYTYLWESSNPAVAEVNNTRRYNTIVTGVSPGDSIIKVEIRNFIGRVVGREYFYVRVASPNHDPIDSVPEIQTTGKAGEVEFNKSAKWLDYDKRLAQIDLDVSGTPKITGSDVILIADRSGSMIRENRMVTTKAASTEFVQSLLGDGNKLGNRIAYIPFAGQNPGPEDPDAIGGSRNFSNSVEGVQHYIDQTAATGGTNYSAAFQKAIDFAKSRGDTERPLYVVFMSDGLPGLSGNSEDDSDWNGVEEAERLKRNYGAELYSIGIQIGEDRPYALTRLASSPDSYYSVSNMTELSPILQEISAKIRSAGSRVILSDYLSEYFEIYKDSFSDLENSVEPNYLSPGEDSDSENQNGKVVFKFDSITNQKQTFSFKVRLKDDFWAENSDFPTNKSVDLEYTDVNGERKTKNVGNPELDNQVGQIPIEYVLVDENGNYIDKKGNLTDSPVVISSENYMDPNSPHKDKTVLELGYHTEIDGRTYQVTPNQLPEGFELFGREEKEKSVSLTWKKPVQTIQYKIVPTPLTFTFTKVDKEEIPLDGAKFFLQNEDGIRIEDSNPAGNQFEFKGLKPGDYTLTEEKAPEGYQLPTESIHFSVKRNPETGHFIVDLENDFKNKGYLSETENGYIFKNFPVGEFPDTGGPGSLIFILLGLLVIATVSFIYFRKNEINT